MSGDELRRRREALGMSKVALAKRLGVTRHAVYLWEQEQRPRPVWLALALRALEHERADRERDD